MEDKINDELSSLAKVITPHEAFQQLYRELLSGVYSNHVAIFTDESKTDQGLGAAAVAPNQTKTESLSEMASAFTAELYATNMVWKAVQVKIL